MSAGVATTTRLRNVATPCFLSVKRGGSFFGRRWLYRYRIFVGEHWQTFYVVSLPFGLAFGLKALPNADVVPDDEPDDVLEDWRRYLSGEASHGSDQAGVV